MSWIPIEEARQQSWWPRDKHGAGLTPMDLSPVRELGDKPTGAFNGHVRWRGTDDRSVAFWFDDIVAWLEGDSIRRLQLGMRDVCSCGHTGQVHDDKGCMLNGCTCVVTFL